MENLTFDEVALITEFNHSATRIHQVNIDAGWWTDVKTGQDIHKTRNVGELIALCHSELSEALEGHRKGLPDEKLPHRSAFEVEIADLFIRALDIVGAYKLDIGGAIVEKMRYNASRADHKIENRKKDGGKKY
jgi:hypothetical protein